MTGYAKGLILKKGTTLSMHHKPMVLKHLKTNMAPALLLARTT